MTSVKNKDINYGILRVKKKCVIVKRSIVEGSYFTNPLVIVSFQAWTFEHTQNGWEIPIYATDCARSRNS